VLQDALERTLSALELRENEEPQDVMEPQDQLDTRETVV